MRKQTITFLILSLAVFTAKGQLTINVTSIPFNTPAGANIHVAGTFNNWNPSDASNILSNNGSGLYQITLMPASGEVKFKFTRGSWATVEGNANGGFLPDRVINYSGQPTTVNLTILSWEDLGGGSGTGTAAPNVLLLDEDFYIPQLDRYRRVWIYLPPDYQTTSKKYPVLYMHDGQNLFDQNTSAFGEWEVDESLNELHAQGDWGCIVVGIDNGEQYRLDEYSPWFNPQYGGGEGDEYVSFIINTLKPFVDANYRTLPGRLTTAIAGSSMGGLISMYALSERQDIFSKAGVFSPAFWFAGNESANHVSNHTKQGPARVYFLAGADEENNGNQSNYVVEDMQAVANAMTTAGFGPTEKSFQVIPDGKHSEWFWAREFPDAYKWLFADFTTGLLDFQQDLQTLQVFPNPSQTWVHFSGPAKEKDLEIQVIGLDGTVHKLTTIAAGSSFWSGDLPSGIYLIKARTAGNSWETGRIIRP